LIKFKDREKEWLLVKRKDTFASEKDITKKDRSVVSKLKIEQLGGPVKKKSAVKKRKQPKLLSSS